jgi:hypothetical protein
MKPGGETVPTGINKTGNDVGWSKINRKIHVESNNPNTEDGMEHYSVNVGYVDVRFMCGNGKGFNVARGINQFIAAARAIDKDFCLLPLGGQYNNIYDWDKQKGTLFKKSQQKLQALFVATPNIMFKQFF